MAGGNITRFVGGENSIETEIWEVFTNDFRAYAGEGSYFTADEETTIGMPKDPEPAGDYFVKGWWSDKNDTPITKAHVGDTIKFHIETKNIPDNGEVTFTVYDWDGMLSVDDKLSLIERETSKEYNKIKITGNKGVLKWTTGSATQSLIDDEEDEIELYVECIYENKTKNETETVELPENESDYLKVYPTAFPLKMHQRSFAPWDKFGNMIWDKLQPNNFYGDGRSFSLKDNFLEGPQDDLETRYQKLKISGNVTSRLYHKIEFDYNANEVVADKTIAICNMTRGQWFFLPFDVATGYKINESPSHIEYYGEHSLIQSQGEKGIINMEIEGSDPMVMPAPDIDWKLLVRLTLNRDEKTLNIKGYAFGKEFPAYEAFIEDYHGTRFFIHTYTPLNEFELSGELLWNLPDYFGNVDITIEVDVDDNGYYFKNNLKSALYTYSELLKEDDYIEKVYENISLDDWNNMHLNKKTSKDL